MKTNGSPIPPNTETEVETDVTDAETPETEVTPPTSVDLPKVRSYTREQAKAQNIVAEKRQDLPPVFKRDERILVFDNPDAPDAPLILHLRALTEKEEASLHTTLLTQQDIQGFVEVFMKKVGTDGKGKLDPKDMEEPITTALRRQQEETDPLYTLCRRIQMGIFNTNYTIQWLQQLNPHILDTCNDVLDELSIDNERWILEDALMELQQQRQQETEADADAEETDTRT